MPPVWKERVRNIFRQIDSDSSIPVKPEVIVLKNGSPSPIAIDPNLYYVAGLGHGLFEDSLLIAHKNGSCNLLVRKSEEMNARENQKGIDVVVLENIVGNHDDDYKKLLSPYSGHVIGLNFERLSHEDYLELTNQGTFTPVDISHALQRSRRIKDSNEIDLIRKACNITSSAYGALTEFLEEGRTELETAAFISGYMQSHGATGLAFDTICAFGKNGADPHYCPGPIRLKKGDFVLTDFGSSVDRYNSDFTRTLVYGKASKVQREMYRDVLAALETVSDACRAGERGKDVERAGKRIVEKSAFKKNFILGTGGHSIGLSVHDGWDIVPTSEGLLEENMVVAIEPGIYLPGIGAVRIEDDMIVRKGRKPELLTRATKQLFEL
ncbi:MAG: M24 family metallopeptidase [Nitrososphaerales archaeon]